MLEENAGKNAFNVPPGYFDQLPTRIQNRCIESKGKPYFWHSIKPQLKYATGVGLVALAALGVFSTDVAERIDARANVQQAMTTNGVDHLNLLIRNVNLTTIDNSYSKAHDHTDNLVNIMSMENLNVDDILNAGFHK